MEGGKHLDHNKVVALCTDNFNIYRESLNLYSSLHFFLLYIEPEMAAGGRFGERFKMRAERPFWSRRELLVIIWLMQILSSVPVFLDNAEPSLRNCVRASLCQPPTEFATMGTNSS